MSDTRNPRSLSAQNQAVRVDEIQELVGEALAAARVFFRRIGLPQVVDEVVLPLLDEGDSQIFTGVRDRPWPPWGLGSRNVVAWCQTYPAGEGNYGVTPVFTGDEEMTNIGLISAVYKEAVESLALRDAEINYVAKEDSVLADHVLRKIGFEKTQDVLLTEAARYFTYRMDAEDLLRGLGLDAYGAPEILAHEMAPDVLERLALFHHTVYLASRAEWTSVTSSARPEMVRLVRFGHFSKPGGTDKPGRFRPIDIIFVLRNGFLEIVVADTARDQLASREADFRPATVQGPGSAQAVVDESARKGVVLADLGDIESAVRSRILESLPEFLAELGLDPFEVGEIEIQASASSDGDYYHAHADTDESSTRVLSFVLFIQQDPRRYSGGELRVFKADLGSGDPSEASQTVVPRHNDLVVFPSELKHEILPVHVPSKLFSDGRFTINGWVHRAP